MGYGVWDIGYRAWSMGYRVWNIGWRTAAQRTGLGLEQSLPKRLPDETCVGFEKFRGYDLWW